MKGVSQGWLIYNIANYWPELAMCNIYYSHTTQCRKCETLGADVPAIM